MQSQEKAVWLPSASTQGKWILVTTGPKQHSKSFREEGNSGLEVNTGKTSVFITCVSYIRDQHICLQRNRHLFKEPPIPGQLNFHHFSHCILPFLAVGEKRAVRRADSWNLFSFNLLLVNAALGLVSGEDSSGSRATHQKMLSIFHQTLFSPQPVGRLADR